MAAWKVCASSIPFAEPAKLTFSKAAKIGKEYEAKGGDHESEPGSKDKPEKGPPQKKSAAQKKEETAAASGSKSAEKDNEVRISPIQQGPVKKSSFLSQNIIPLVWGTMYSRQSFLVVAERIHKSRCSHPDLFSFLDV